MVIWFSAGVYISECLFGTTFNGPNSYDLDDVELHLLQYSNLTMTMTMKIISWTWITYIVQ